MSNFVQLDLIKYDGEYLYNQTLDLAKNNIHWHPYYNEICLNSSPKRPNDHLYGCGSFKFDWENKTTVETEDGETKIQIPIRKNPPTQDEFTMFNEKFSGTVFEEIYYKLTKKYRLGRTRLMTMEPKKCLTWHNDFSKRLHLPIKTNVGCQMIIENEVLHMPAGTLWMTDTTKKHTALNASEENRIHLVAVVLETLD